MSGTKKCPFCSFCPTSMDDFCEKHRPKFDLAKNDCKRCGHPKRWHDSQRCWGDPGMKGICSEMCKRFVPKAPRRRKVKP